MADPFNSGTTGVVSINALNLLLGAMGLELISETETQSAAEGVVRGYASLLDSMIGAAAAEDEANYDPSVGAIPVGMTNWVAMSNSLRGGHQPTNPRVNAAREKLAMARRVATRHNIPLGKALACVPD